jgi:hypothetical protein
MNTAAFFSNNVVISQKFSRKQFCENRNVWRNFAIFRQNKRNFVFLRKMETGFYVSTLSLDKSLPGMTFPFSRPGPKAFTLEASAGPSPFPPKTHSTVALSGLRHKQFSTYNFMAVMEWAWVDRKRGASGREYAWNAWCGNALVFCENVGFFIFANLRAKIHVYKNTQSKIHKIKMKMLMGIINIHWNKVFKHFSKLFCSRKVAFFRNEMKMVTSSC